MCASAFRRVPEKQDIIVYGYLDTSETDTSAHQTKERFTQINSKQYHLTTNPCSVYIRLSYEHQAQYN